MFESLVTLSILSQIPHAYWAIDRFSLIENKALRISQNAIFCVIISIGILAFAIRGLHWYALGGTVIEIVINIYYIQTGIDQIDKRSSKAKRKNWLGWFLAFLIPFTIFIFSLQIKS